MKRYSGLRLHPGSRAAEISVNGVVQGVGFRPFIFRLAHDLGYFGWVRNMGDGVRIHLEKQEVSDFSDFLSAFDKNLPPLAQIEKLEIEKAEYAGLSEFKIAATGSGDAFVFISPDISVCSSCVHEMNDPGDRRYRYPFINCTDCGPRYTIVHALPYDRIQTTMSEFRMCPECRKEYTNPYDRRYHAQPIACPECGPSVVLKEAGSGKIIAGDIHQAGRLIDQGHILGVKGLGGFHLVCSPFDEKAVSRLREIKSRKTKPLAMMARDLEVVEKFGYLSEEEKGALLSPRRPIVLLKKKHDIPLIAPNIEEFGFMLPYTPLHHLLLENRELIVATSSNKKDAPIIKDESEGLSDLCDAILTHNRPIYMRADDSVMKIVNRRPLFVRRARGYVPYPQAVPQELRSTAQILAVGAELKDTISIYKNGYVVTSQFLGDLDDYRNYGYFEETIDHLTSLFDVSPDIIVSDLHPRFHSTRYAEKSGLPHLRVPHHFAHILAPMLESGIPLQKKVLGVALDGYGYGPGGEAWGGEFLICDFSSSERAAHLSPVPLPGGDLAAKQPWRMALVYLKEAFGPDIPRLNGLLDFPEKESHIILQMIERNYNTPLTSSCGRLFDAVSYMIGAAPAEIEYEAEAPMRLESVCSQDKEYIYPVEWNKIPGKPQNISFRQTIRSIVRDLEKGVDISLISAGFHNTLAQMILSAASKSRESSGIDTVVLVGGVFLNRQLLLRAEELLEKSGFQVIRPHLYSPGDESISLGQIAYALNHSMKNQKRA